MMLGCMLNATGNNDIVWIFNELEMRVHCDGALNRRGNRRQIVFGSLFTRVYPSNAIEVT